MIINTLIGSLSGTNAMKSNLQKKLSAIYNLTSLADIIVDKTYAQNVEILGKAISSRAKVVLKDYEMLSISQR